MFISQNASRMATSKVGSIWTLPSRRTTPSRYACVFRQQAAPPKRLPDPLRTHSNGPRPDQGPFRTRLRIALGKTKVEWRPIPITLGIGFLGAVQFYRVRKREQARQDEEQEQERQSQRPAKRKRIKPSGPW